MDAAELAAWAAKHEAQIDAALERVTQRSEQTAGTVVGEAVSLEDTTCHFVFLAVTVPNVERTTLALWRCGNAAEAAAAAASGSHAGVRVRDGTRPCVDKGDAAQAALLLAAQARKRGKKPAAGAKSAAPPAEADKPRERAGTAATRERDAADSGEPSSTPAKKQKTQQPEAQVVTGPSMTTPAAATPAPVPAAPAAAAQTGAPAPISAGSARISVLETALASAQASLASSRRDVARITHRCDALEAAHAAEREAADKLRAAAATAETAAAALVLAARGVTAARRSADE
jgi:hypothetical protein